MDKKQKTMTRILVLITLGIGATAQEELMNHFFDGTYDANFMGTINGTLKSSGPHDCYPSDDTEMFNKCNNKIRGSRSQNQLSQLLLDDVDNALNKQFCCIPRDVVKPETECGVRLPDGYITPGSQIPKRENARTVLKGEFPWRALIWRKDGIDGPLCAGTVIDQNTKVILTSANCALLTEKENLMVTFERTREGSVQVHVKEIIAHEEYNTNIQFVNDIALVVLDTEYYSAPSWVKPACFSNRPPMHAIVCTTMSAEDYFIETAVPLNRVCEVDNVKIGASQMCSVTLGDEYRAELGAGLFCTDQERTQNFNFYVSGITLQVRGQLIIYTKVSNFQEWIQNKLDNIE